MESYEMFAIWKMAWIYPITTCKSIVYLKLFCFRGNKLDIYSPRLMIYINIVEKVFWGFCGEQDEIVESSSCDAEFRN